MHFNYQVSKLNIIMFSVDKSYSSNVLFTQPFDPSNDITLSFLYTDFETEDLGLLRTESEDYLLLQDGSDFRLNIGRGIVDGLSVFLINDEPGTTLIGGGSAANNPGLNLVTDTVTTDLSALSGILLIAAIDNTGYFGLSGALPQFQSGNTTRKPEHIVVRTANRTTAIAVASTLGVEGGIDEIGTENSDRLGAGSSIVSKGTTFDFKGSVPLSAIERQIVDGKYNIFSIGFKRHLQDVAIYNRESTIIETVSTVNTGIPLNTLPSSVRLGISYSGYMPMEIKNITVNGNIIG